MTDLREKVARALRETPAYSSVVWKNDLHRADAVLSLARPAIIEECAKLVDNFDWSASGTPEMTKTEAIASAIRALSEKPR